MAMAAYVALLSVLQAGGHQSPIHAVEALNARITAEGASARLLSARAYENRALGNWSAVAADFSAVLQLEPQSREALVGCAEALLQLDAFSKAEAMARRGLALAHDATERGPFYALLAEVFARQLRWLDALDAWREALRSAQPEIDWFLGEAESLARLERHSERVASLAQAMERNPSVALRRAWVRALVDAGELETASQEIELGIAQSRWQSSWLLLQAEVFGQRQRQAEKKTAAAVALSEIESRLNFHHPDPYLLKDAAQALAYLGDTDKALLYLEKARALGVSETELNLVKQAIH